MASEDAIDALGARVDAHYRELKELRGRVNAFRRWERHNEAETAEDAPGATLEPEETIPNHRKAIVPTAALARRFRGF